MVWSSGVYGKTLGEMGLTVLLFFFFLFEILVLFLKMVFLYRGFKAIFLKYQM